MRRLLYYILAFHPHSNEADGIALARDFVTREFVARGMIATSMCIGTRPPMEVLNPMPM